MSKTDAANAAVGNSRLREQYGPVALVTGASDGIGEAFARVLAEKGLDLLLVARRRERLERLAVELKDEFGIEVTVEAADLGDPSAVSRLIERSRPLEVGLLVACAGYGTSGRFLETDAADELAMLDVNCRAVLTLCKAFSTRFADLGRGGIILMSSIVAFQGVPNAANYAATKAYVQTLAEGLRAELAPLGVAVLASAPGPVHSGFATRANMRFGKAVSPMAVARESLAALGRQTTVHPGLLSKVLSYALSPLPRNGRVFIMKQVMKGMTKHQYAKPQEQA